MAQSGLLLAGTFGVPGNHSISEELAARLDGAAGNVIATSSKKGRVARFCDTILTVWKQRHEYTLAQVDVYSGTAFRLAEATCWALRRAGKPYILTLRGGNLPNFAARHDRRVRRLLGSAACITTPSRYLLEQMQPYCEMIRLLPNPVPIEHYPFRHRESAGRSIVWLRTFCHIYNPPLAPRVVSLLYEQFEDVKLTMIGPDKHDGSLSAVVDTIKQTGVGDCVQIVGPITKSEVPTWLQRSDVFLNTTNMENTPISVLEAMACGLCVVSTNVGGVPYLLTHEEDALLVPPNDPHAMADALRRIWTEPGLASHLSANARRKAESFDWSRVLPQWKSIFQSVSELAS